ncbi:UNVERIFIED_CONTAM: hypothetical protein NCL1_30601 [Trichonephila clavipes]
MESQQFLILKKSRETILNFVSKLDSEDGSKKRETLKEANDVALDHALYLRLWSGTNNNHGAVLLNYCCSRESETL